MAHGSVLIIEDDLEFLRAVGIRLKHYGIDISSASNATEGFWKAVCEHPAVIVSDLTMPDGDGQYLLNKVKSHPLTREIPFIVLTGRQELGLERHLRAVGAIAYLRKPLILSELLTALRPHVRVAAPAAQPMPRSNLVIATILIADDDRDLVEALRLRCRALGLEVQTAHDGYTALTLAHQCRPDLICLDVNMPGGGGLSVCDMLADDDRLATVPIIILTGQSAGEVVRRCWDRCAYYVLKSTDTWQRMEPLIRELCLQKTHGIDDPNLANPAP